MRWSTRSSTALTDAATDDSLRAIHIRGEGGDFCAGADWVATNSGGQRPRAGDLVRRIPHTSHRLVELCTPSTFPWSAACAAGPSGSAATSRSPPTSRVAADDAVFWEPFVTRGFSPDSGSTWLLPRLVGLARARRMLLLGEKVTAVDAADWGLIHDAVDAAGPRRGRRGTAGPARRGPDGRDRAGQAGQFTTASTPPCPRR